MSAIESAWAITSYASIIAIMLLTSICLCYFVRPYLKSKKAPVYAGIAYFSVVLSLYIVPLRINNFAAYALGILAAFIVMYVEDRRNVEQKIFLAVTFFSVRWFTIAMAGKIDSALIEGIVMKRNMAGRPLLQFGTYAAIKMLNVGIGFIFLAVSTYLLNKSFKYKNANITKKELLMLVMPSLSGMTGYGILQFYQNIYERDTGKSLASVHGIYGYLCFLHYLISVISILAMVIVFQKQKAWQLESAGQKLMQSQITDMKRHIKEVEKLYQDIRMLRHDMGNHIQTIENLLDNDDRKDAIEYAARLREEWQDISYEIKTGNPVTDVVLMEKKKEAEGRHIKFFCDFHYPERTKIDAFDISVILNNALDNSMEAVNGASPYISISSFQKNNIFMILFSNSFEGNIVMDDDTGLPVSTKRKLAMAWVMLQIE